MPRRGYAQEIASLLFKQGILKKADASALASGFRGSGQAQIHDFLLEQDLVSKPDLLRVLSQYYGTPAIDINGVQFNHDLVRMFPTRLLTKYTVIPLEMDENAVIFVAARPDADKMRQQLRHYTDCHLEFIVGIAKDIAQAIATYHDEPPNEVAEKDDFATLEGFDESDFM